MAAIGRKDLQTAAFLKLCKLALAVKNEVEPDAENIKANHRPFLMDKSAAFVKPRIIDPHTIILLIPHPFHLIIIFLSVKPIPIATSSFKRPSWHGHPEWIVTTSHQTRIQVKNSKN